MERQPSNVTPLRPGESLPPRIPPHNYEAEQALLAEHLEDAERLTNAARTIDPGHVRVVFLTAQIAKERARALPVVAKILSP